MINKENNNLSSPFRGTGGVGAIIYNVTVKVEPAIADAWLHWVRTEHAPEMLATQCFTEYKVVKLLEVDESEGPTFAIQYFALDLEKYKEYLTHHAAGLRKKAFDKWSNQFIAFRTLMEVL